jgi:Zn-dependent protease
LLGIDIAQLFIAFSVLLFSLTIHGWAHAGAAAWLGDRTARGQGRLSLNPRAHVDPLGTMLCPLLAWCSGAPLVGWARSVPFDARARRHPGRDRVLVAAAGPVSHVIVALASAALLAWLPVSPVRLGEPNVSAPLAALLSRGVHMNLMLAIFHLLPIPPLDGGVLLGAALPNSVESGLDRLRPYGAALLYMLVATQALGPVVMPPYNLLRAWLL